MRIEVETVVDRAVADVWRAYTTPDDIIHWNAASDDWHTTASTVDLRVGGRFSSRMEAKDGSFGFDFEGVYTRVEPGTALAYDMGGRQVDVAFAPGPEGVRVTVAFDPEREHPPEMQRQGWQAILDRFARHCRETCPAPGIRPA